MRTARPATPMQRVRLVKGTRIVSALAPHRPPSASDLPFTMFTHTLACVLTGDICACVSISKRSTPWTGCMMHTEPFLLDMQFYYAACCADMRHGAPNSNRADVEAGCVLQAHPRAIERFHQLRISAGHVSRRICFQWCHCTRCASYCWHGFILRKHSH